MKKLLDPGAKTEANCGPSEKAHKANLFERGTRARIEAEAFLFRCRGFIILIFILSLEAAIWSH
jgi:hypothetical protein